MISDENLRLICGTIIFIAFLIFAYKVIKELK
jgi:hypothetical protein